MTITEINQDRDVKRIDALPKFVPLPNEKLARFIGSSTPLLSARGGSSEFLCDADQMIAGTDFP
jgi:hypothetical protein